MNSAVLAGLSHTMRPPAALPRYMEPGQLCGWWAEGFLAESEHSPAPSVGWWLRWPAVRVASYKAALFGGQGKK